MNQAVKRWLEKNSDKYLLVSIKDRYTKSNLTSIKDKNDKSNLVSIKDKRER